MKENQRTIFIRKDNRHFVSDTNILNHVLQIIATKTKRALGKNATLADYLMNMDEIEIDNLMYLTDKLVDIKTNAKQFNDSVQLVNDKNKKNDKKANKQFSENDALSNVKMDVNDFEGKHNTNDSEEDNSDDSLITSIDDANAKQNFNNFFDSIKSN